MKNFAPYLQRIALNSHAICTPPGGTRPLSSWLSFLVQLHSINSDAANWSYYLTVSIPDLCRISYQLYWGYTRLIWENDKLIALQLTLVSMLNFIAVVFTSVLDIAGKPLYNVACVVIVFSTCN